MVLKDAAELRSRVAQAIASLRETARESSMIAARSRTILAGLKAPKMSRFCACGSIDAYTTLVTPRVIYRRCRGCGNIWAWNAAEQVSGGAGA
jgi:hypothetical protein